MCIRDRGGGTTIGIAFSLAALFSPCLSSSVSLTPRAVITAPLVAAGTSCSGAIKLCFAECGGKAIFCRPDCWAADSWWKPNCVSPVGRTLVGLRRDYKVEVNKGLFTLFIFMFIWYALYFIFIMFNVMLCIILSCLMLCIILCYVLYYYV